MQPSLWLGLAGALLTIACGGDDAEFSRAAGDGGGGDAPSAGGGDPASGGQQAGGGVPDTPQVSYPDPDWPEALPEEQGFDAAQLEEAAAIADALDSYCLLVIRNGQLVFERYFRGHDAYTPQKSFSVAKSYTSALVGIAIARGDIEGLDQSAADFIPEWQGTSREAITIEHLLTMTSGLHWDVFTDYVSMVTLSDDHSGFAVGLAHDGAPGGGWTYHNGAVQIFEPLFRAATGMDMEAYANAHLWSRIGMSATSWAKDPSGQPTAYASVMASCRDHARFGYLYRHAGAWKGEAIVPASWVSASLTPSQSVNRAYGFLWWLHGETPAIGALGDAYDGQLSAVSPGDAFLARGFGSQFIEVIPSQELLIVRFGKDPVVGLDFQALFDDQNVDIHDAVVGAVLDALQ